MISGKPAQTQQLENAFQVFNQVSEQLAVSYRQLQERVFQLSRELAAARTERMRQLAETERLAHWMAQLLDALPAAVVVIDDSGFIQQFNPAAEILFSDLTEGGLWSDVQETQFIPGQQGDEYRLNSGRLVSMTRRTLHPEPGQILLMLDITTTRDLQERLERRQRLSAMGEMAAQLAHQIRTPLSSALLYTAHLSRDDLSREQRERFSGHTRTRLSHMERQINQMLAFARGGQFKPRKLDLVPLLHELVQQLEPQAREDGLLLDLMDESGGQAEILGNPDALLGALVNLARNALEHVGQGGEIHIRLARAADGWQLCFQDNGPGIPEELQTRIFDPFFTTRTDGTGLGLAVVQDVVLSHQGRIRVQSESEGGTCFILTLPADPSEEDITGQGPIAHPPEIQKLTVVRNSV